MLNLKTKIKGDSEWKKRNSMGPHDLKPFENLGTPISTNIFNINPFIGAFIHPSVLSCIVKKHGLVQTRSRICKYINLHKCNNKGNTGNASVKATSISIPSKPSMP